MRTNCDLLRCLDRSRCVSTSLFSMIEGVEWFSNSFMGETEYITTDFVRQKMEDSVLSV